MPPPVRRNAAPRLTGAGVAAVLGLSKIYGSIPALLLNVMDDIELRNYRLHTYLQNTRRSYTVHVRRRASKAPPRRHKMHVVQFKIQIPSHKLIGIAKTKILVCTDCVSRKGQDFHMHYISLNR